VSRPKLLSQSNNKTRRDFLILTSIAMGGVGIAAFAWPFLNSMRPAADTLANSTLDVDLEPILEGQAITVMWQGKPVFIRHRTKSEISRVRLIDISLLVDPEKDEDRFPLTPEWLVIVGVCTHLGCIPLGQKTNRSKRRV